MTLDNCYQLGNIIKAHGLAGEVQLYLDVDFPQEYENLESIFILLNNKLVPFFIESIQINATKALVAIEGINSREEAEELGNKPVYLPLSFLPKLPEDKYYYHEVAGYDFYDHGKLIGKVVNVIDLSAQPLLTIEVEGKEVLVPLQDDIVTKVDKEKMKIEARLPDGLLEIYLEDDGKDED